MRYEYKFLIALGGTILIEIVALFLIVRVFYRIDRNQLSNVRLLFSGFICSFSTLPYLWFLLPVIMPSRNVFITVGEIFVILIETLIYYFLLHTTMKKATVISMACNSASFLIGLLFFA
jgi:hypothetical protein